MIRKLFDPLYWLASLTILVGVVCAILLLKTNDAGADEITFQCHDKQVQVDSDLGLSGTEKICVNESYVCTIFGGEMHCTVKR